MKRYLLFAGFDYYPLGGWDDFKGDFDTKESALVYCTSEIHSDWFQVVDTETKEKLDFRG